MKKKDMSTGRKLLYAALTVLLLVAAALFTSDGKILSEVPNLYFTAQGGSPFRLTLHPYGLGVALAGLVSLSLFVYCEKGDERAFRFSALCALLAFVLSRLLYVLVNASFYFRYSGLIAMLRADEGGMSMSGALLGAWIAFLLLYGRSGRPARGLTFAFSLFVPLERLCEFLSENGLGVGREVELDEGLFAVSGDWSCLLRVYLIEAILGALILLFVILLSKGRMTDGEKLFRVFIWVYGITQVMMESLRGDHHMEWGFVKAQMFFAFLPAMGVLILESEGKKRKLLSLGLSVVFAGAVFALEKARDRGWIPSEEGVYAVFTLVTVLFLMYGLLTLLRKIGKTENVK